MAEGGSLDRTIDKSSEVFYDYNCSDCLSRKNAYSEAVFYCPECHKYLCKPCLTCAHDVIGRGNVTKWGKPSTRSQFDPCPNHKGNAIQLYCSQHDVVCCPVCSQTQHKSCGDSIYIPLVANAKENKTDLQTVKKGLSDLLTKADKIRKDRTTRLTGLDKTEQQLMDSVKDYRAKIDAWLDDLEEQSIEDIKKFKVLFMDRYKSELEICDTIKTEMTDLKKKLDLAVKDESLLFSRIKRGKEQVHVKSHLISDLEGCDIADKAQFVPCTKLEELVKGQQGLGQLLTETPAETIPTRWLGKVKNKQGQGPVSQFPLSNQPYTVRHKTSFSVQTADDKKACSIRGMCQLPDGSIIVADYNNNRLKQLDSTYKVISSCSLTSVPNDVCHTEAGQVAVGLYDNTIQFVSVGNTMTRTSSFTTDHDCDSLAYSNKCIYVTAFLGTNVHVYNLSGTRRRTISTDEHGRQLFSSTSCITISPNGARLHITDNRGLVTMDTRGNFLATFGSPELVQGAFAVCVDRAGNVFVGSNYSKHALQVGGKGDRKVAEILSPSDGIDIYQLCFDGVNSRLLVSDFDSGTVHVLHLSK